MHAQFRWSHTSFSVRPVRLLRTGQLQAVGSESLTMPGEVTGQALVPRVNPGLHIGVAAQEILDPFGA